MALPYIARIQAGAEISMGWLYQLQGVIICLEAMLPGMQMESGLMKMMSSHNKSLVLIKGSRSCSKAIGTMKLLISDSMNYI